MADTILHNQPIGTPSDSERIAYGTPTSPSGNITLGNFYTLLMSKLGFFKVGNFFSEIFGNVSAMASARANIDVYSKAETDSELNLRANRNQVIEKYTAVAFTPVSAFDPVNKGYVDGKKIVGTFQYNEPWNVQQRVVAIGQVLPSNNYTVILESATTSAFRGMYPLSVQNKTTSAFTIAIDIENSNVLSQPLIRWTILL